MPFSDFREFLAALRAHGELIEIDRPVDLYCEVGKNLRQGYFRNGPAMQFNNNGTAFPLVANVYATRSKAMIAFEATEDTIFDKVLHGLDHPIAPTMYSGPAPCQEVVITGDDIDIRDFPIPQYSPKDGGPYITPGITVSSDPETGIPDIGHYRFTPMSRNTFGGSFQPSHRFGKHIIKSRARGARQQAAIVLGCDPILAYTAQVQATDTSNDWEIAGGLRGAPVELVKCKTVDVEVPATAEIIIEIEADASVNVMEGPLGEYTGYYTPPSEKPLIHITAITHRRNPIMQGLLTGKPVTDNHVLKQVPFEASIYRTLKRQFPTLEKVCIPPSGGVSFYTIIALQERFAGEARQAILATMSSNIRPKWVIAVEPDIDVYDPVDVNWALSFRVQPARDIFTVDNIPAGPSDPSVAENRIRTMRLFSAVGVDATRPFGQPFHEVADVPGWREYDVPELRGLSLVNS